jgi:hypothetical protein
MSKLKITRRYADSELTFVVTEDELLTWFSSLPMDERLVLLRKLAGKDLERLTPTKILGGLLKKRSV